MKTGFTGTFVMTWAQTEVDGLGAAPVSALDVGASWRWSGRAMRIDGPQDVLRLHGAEGDAEFRARAARKVRRMLGAAMSADGPASGEGEDEPLFGLGFTVTDGYNAFAATLVRMSDKSPTLVMFEGALPPVDTDLWVVRAQVEAGAVNRLVDQPVGVICFTPGTRIRTAEGDVAVEDIAEGDRIQTKDDGEQEVLWIGRKRISGARLYALPELRPIRLRRGALGLDRPDEDLIVSPNHRLLLKGARARALFNEDEVLVRALDLVDDHRVVRDHSLASVEYVHLLLPRHEVVFANGLETESFHPGAEAIDTVEAEQRARLEHMLPELIADPMTYGDYARRALTRAEAAILTAEV